MCIFAIRRKAFTGVYNRDNEVELTSSASANEAKVTQKTASDIDDDEVVRADTY